MLSIGLALATAAGAEQTGKVVEDPYGESHAPPKKIDVTPAVRGYSPYAGRKFPTRVLWAIRTTTRRTPAMPSPRGLD